MHSTDLVLSIAYAGNPRFPDISIVSAALQAALRSASWDQASLPPITLLPAHQLNSGNLITTSYSLLHGPNAPDTAHKPELIVC